MQPAMTVDTSTVTRDRKHGFLFYPVHGPREKLKKLDFNCLTAARGCNTAAPENRLQSDICTRFHMLNNLNL